MKTQFSLLLFLGVVLHIAWSQEKCSSEYLEAKLADPKHLACLHNYLNQTEAEDEFNRAIIEDDIESFMKNNCPKWNNAVECLDPYFQEILPCLNLEHQMLYKTAKKVVLTSIQYICEHHGKKILEFVRNGGLECIYENKEDLKKCLTEGLGEEITSAEDMEKEFMSNADLKSDIFTIDKCKLLHNATDCVVHTLKKSCTNQTQDFFNNYLHTTIKQTPCWGILGLLADFNWEQYLLSVLVPKHIPTRDRQCSNVTDVNAYDQGQVALKNASKCWAKHIDNQFLIKDATQAIQSKTLVSFLKNYCPKLHGLGECAGDYLDSFQPCVERDSEDSITLNSTKRILQKVINFVCHRDGERILLFMKEKGIQCLDEKKEDIKDCVELAGVTDLFSSGNIDDIDPLTALQNLWVPQNYRPEECRVIVSLEVCVYKTMRKCKDSSPANLISSLIRSVARESPCWKIETGGATSVMGQGHHVLPAVTAVLLAFWYWTSSA